MGEPLDTDAELEPSRSASATSSLDPYYFGVGSPSESPVLLPTGSNHVSLKTPEMQSFREPVTPGKDPAAIDRRGLVGVGELATPRWTRAQPREPVEVDEQLDEAEEDDVDGDAQESYADAREKDPDLPDSPWTIEAIDGEQDETDDVSAACLSPSLSYRLFIFSSSTYSLRLALCVRGAQSRTKAAERRSCTLASLSRPFHPSTLPAQIWSPPQN